MNEKEFCLLDMPWICVIDFDCNVSEVSLVELFKKAHLYKGLAGELPTQDFAVLRLLLAVLHTVFSRYAPNGESSPITDPDDALDRWQEIWDGKRFPERVITDYLETQRENFYLFHPERPFYQVKCAMKGTEYTAAKLNGNLSESSNKLRLFTNVSGKAKDELSFSEAARWLIYVNAYDDTSGKKSAELKRKEKESGEKADSAGVGWLGKLGLISVEGNNLFETLMLNLIPVDENGEVYGKENPIWEREKIPDGERVKIAFPDNLSELYTLQSRRLYLKRNAQSVTGYYLLGGDYFDKENAFIEPMTIWRNPDKKKTEIFSPHRHNASKQFWRDFSALTQSEGVRRPGIISWLGRLERENLTEDFALNLKIASVQYGDKDFFVTNVFSDSLQMHASLLSDMSEKWRNMVIECISFCDKIAYFVGELAKKVNLASGGSDSTKDSKGTAFCFAENAKADFYSRIDAPFRKWLCGLDPENDDALEKETEWRHECVRAARKLGDEIMARADPEAIFGRKGSSAAHALNTFRSCLKKAENK